MTRPNRNGSNSDHDRITMRIDLHGYASFRTWTSHEACVTFFVNLRTREDGHQETRVGKKFWGQAPTGRPGRYRKPYFKPADLRKLEQKAINKAKERLSRQNRQNNREKWIEVVLAGDADAAAKKAHRVDLCERCKELGYSCVARCVIEVLEGQFVCVSSRHEWKKRCERIHQCGETTLYHQTNEEAAAAIIRSQEMRRGGAGYWGGGIYFCRSQEDTNHKAQQRGVILECKVLLGRTKVLHQGQSDITFASLLVDGFDSVRGTCRRGDEFIVYNKDQVTSICRR